MYEREELLISLYEEILGPRNGPYETIKVITVKTCLFIVVEYEAISWCIRDSLSDVFQ